MAIENKIDQIKKRLKQLDTERKKLLNEMSVLQSEQSTEEKVFESVGYAAPSSSKQASFLRS